MENTESDIINAISTIQETLKEDKDYYYSWQANIAMAFKDEYYRCKKKYKNRNDIHEIANQAAKNFIDLFTSKDEDEDLIIPLMDINIDEIKTLEDSFDFIIGMNGSDDPLLIKWLALKEDEALCEAHHGLGQYLRNTLQLWHNGPMVSYFNDIGIYHADDMSGIILTSFHRRQNNKELKIDSQVKHYRDHWNKYDPNVNKGMKE